MILETQKYLQTKSLNDLKSELGISYSEYKSLVVLNYSLIDSPKFHPIVLECRGLILEKDTWKIVSFPFKRFFNTDEDPNLTFDYSNAVGLEKLDGSLIQVFYYNEWLMSSRGQIENNCCVPMSNLTFKELFNLTINDDFYSKLNNNYNYIFELTSPENRIVTIYKDRQLHLLSMRNIDTWKELTLNELKRQSDIIGVPLPRIVNFKDKIDIVELSKSVATLDEGFVAVDYNDHDDISFKRIKVKNPSYVAIQHLKENSARSLRSLISLVYENQQDEFLSYFPEFQNHVDLIKEKYDNYINNINLEKSSILDYLKIDKKEYALKVKNFKNLPFMFNLYNGKCKTFLEFLSSIEKLKGRKYLEKYLVEQLKLKDINFYVEE
jgi:T4 RnlA family RNA ligase